MEISIFVITYNHAKYVRQALDSIFAQKIDVTYEVLILDDASTDGTQEILKEYKEKYPELITLYLNEVNSYCPTKNGNVLRAAAKGKYIASLEGDDYWLDDRKLQRQYDLLEQHLEYSACCSDVKIVDENNNEIFKSIAYEKKDNSVYTIEDFKKLTIGGMTASFFQRNYYREGNYRDISLIDKIMGDITRNMICLLHGDIYQFKDQMAAYRSRANDKESNFNSIHKNNPYKTLMHFRYWIRLENYMIKNYSADYEFIPLKKRLVHGLGEYSCSDVIKTIKESERKYKYLGYYIGGHHLRQSVYHLNRKKVIKQKKWKKFLKDKRPIVIFGAGAVAGEFIRKYGWKKDIMYLVDNAAEKHNRPFMGYFIRKPEELLYHAKNVSVLIANYDHERAIEQQLKDMGVESYYFYCSMQSRRLCNRVAVKLIGR